MSGRVLHIVPDSVGRLRHRFLGSTKDVLGRTEYFEDRRIPYDVVMAVDRDDGRLLATLRAMDLSPYRAAIFELPLYPRSLAWMRAAWPGITRITRPINAEFLHQLHRATSHWRHACTRYRRLEPLYDLGRGLRRLRLDAQCAARSDVVLSISEWETEHYWKRLTRSSKVLTVPYFLPRSYKQDLQRSAERETVCVCLLSTSYNLTALPFDAGVNFSRLVWAMGDKRPEWRFAVTGSLSVKNRDHKTLDASLWLPPRVEKLGFLDSPLELLGRARAVAIISDLGYGFKTKIVEAIESGCWVFVGNALYDRLPPYVQRFCQRVDPREVRTFFKALDHTEKPFPEGSPNNKLRKHAFKSLDELLAPAASEARHATAFA